MIKALCASLVSLGLAACIMTTPESEMPEGNWLLPGTTWKLVELDGAPHAGNTTATLTDDGRVTGQAPCNAFNATYKGQWPNLTFDPVTSTRMACPELAEETAFFAALHKVNHAEMQPGSMLLSGPDGTSLRFVRG